METEISQDNLAKFKICCLRNLKPRAFIDSLLIFDIIFFISSLTINLLITLTEALGAIPDHTILYQVTFYILFIINILGFILAGSLKGAWKRWLQKQKTKKFRVYFYYRWIWSIACLLICLIILIFGIFDLRADHGENDFEEIKFVRISITFCFVYFGYCGFTLMNNGQFMEAWFKLIEKDIDFYYE